MLCEKVPTSRFLIITQHKEVWQLFGLISDPRNAILLNHFLSQLIEKTEYWCVLATLIFSYWPFLMELCCSMEERILSTSEQRDFEEFMACWLSSAPYATLLMTKRRNQWQCWHNLLYKSVKQKLVSIFVQFALYYGFGDMVIKMDCN